MRLALTRSSNYKYWGFGAVAIGTFASVADHGSVNVALPTIASHFQVDLPTVQWVIISFSLTVSALLMPMGRLSDILGRKEIFVAGSLVAAAGAALAGVSHVFTLLVVARVLQGLGNAMTQGTGMAIITSIFPPSERGKAIGMIMTIVGTGSVAGPAVGGILVDTLGWRWAFYYTIPLVLAGMVATMFVLEGRRKSQEGDPQDQRSFDWAGAALSTAALVTILITVMNAHKVGLSSPYIFGGLVGFVALLSGFIWWELRTPSPMLDLRYFKERTYSFGVSSAFLTFLGSSAVLFLTPFYLQKVLGFEPLMAGLMVVPGAACMAVLGPVCGHLSDRFGSRKFTVGGLCLSASGLAILSRVSEDTSVFMVIPALMLQSSGMGVFYSPNTSSILSVINREKYGVVSAFLNLVRNGANVASVAVATAIVTATMAFHGYEPSLAAVSDAAGEGVKTVFVLGTRNAYTAMMCLLLAAMTMSAFNFHRVKEMPPVPSA